MSKEAGVSRHPSAAESRKRMGLKVWESDEVFRSGKTRKDLESGAHANHLRNREARRQDNQRKAGKRVA